MHKQNEWSNPKMIDVLNAFMRPDAEGMTLSKFYKALLPTPHAVIYRRGFFDAVQRTR